MYGAEVFFFKDGEKVPVLDWIRKLRSRNKRVAAKCIEAIARLEEEGHRLGRPTSGTLRDGIFELRIRDGSVNYRILYFFAGKGIAVLGHGLTKEKEVPSKDIERAIERKRAYEANPDLHTYKIATGS